MSETKNLKLFKHDNPTTNTNKFDVEKALNQNWDKIDEYSGKVNQQFSEMQNSIEESKVEQTILMYKIPIAELIQKETEYTLPCNYIVGNNSLRVHWENVLLEEGENGNYMEIGDSEQTSNKIKFGWDIEPGETLIIEVRGVVDE